MGILLAMIPIRDVIIILDYCPAGNTDTFIVLIMDTVRFTIIHSLGIINALKDTIPIIVGVITGTAGPINTIATVIKNTVTGVVGMDTTVLIDPTAKDMVGIIHTVATRVINTIIIKVANTGATIGTMMMIGTMKIGMSPGVKDTPIMRTIIRIAGGGATTSTVLMMIMMMMTINHVGNDKAAKKWTVTEVSNRMTAPAGHGSREEVDHKTKPRCVRGFFITCFIVSNNEYFYQQGEGLNNF